MFLFFTILALILAILAVIFSLQNAGLITVSLFTASFEGSLALVLIITFVVGVITGVILMAPYLFKARIRERKLRLEIRKERAEKDRIQNLTDGNQNGQSEENF